MTDQRIKRLDAAISEAERFIAAAKAERAYRVSCDSSYVSNSRQGGTCRRASMDLTNALVEVRR